MEFFSERIGLYAYEKLANVEAAGLGGGTETFRHGIREYYGLYMNMNVSTTDFRGVMERVCGIQGPEGHIRFRCRLRARIRHLGSGYLAVGGDGTLHQEEMSSLQRVPPFC